MSKESTNNDVVLGVNECDLGMSPTIIPGKYEKSFLGRAVNQI